MTVKSKKAFTLIELLVVVLIIGILAAVALPQYQVSVAKARMMQNVVSANALLTAVKSYRLANNAWPSNLNELDVSVASNCGIWVNEAGTSSEQFVISCENNSGKYRIHWATNGNGNVAKYCGAYSGDSVSNQVCKSMSGRTTNSATISSSGLLLYILQ